MVKFYGVSNIHEVFEYLKHPILGQRLKEILKILLNHKNKSAVDIFGEIDALKLKSSMTLYDLVQSNDIFNGVFSTFYNEVRDEKTLQLL